MFSTKLYWNNRPKRKVINDTSIKVSIPDITSLWYISDELGEIKESAPNLFRKVSGDFEVKIKISGFNKHMITQHDQAGLVIRESKTVYMRYGIEMLPCIWKPTQIEPCVRPVMVKQDMIDTGSMIPLTDAERKYDSYWFSVKRKRGIMTAYCSADGETYKMVRRFRLSGEDRLSVGIYGANPLGGGFKIIYEDFSITETKVDRSMSSTELDRMKDINKHNFETWKHRRRLNALPAH